jgi:nitrogen regulatory protein PII
MIKMKKVEIIVEALETENITNILETIGVSGFTILNDISGRGERGNRLADELTDVFKNKYIITICEENKVSKIVESVRPILKKVGGVCLVSDVHWVEH